MKQELKSGMSPIIDQEFIMDQAMGLLDDILKYKTMLLNYACAIKEINTKFEVLNTEFRVRYERNPINTIHTRLKSQTSIMEKADRIGIVPTVENIESHINDVAGMRVICSYIDDIYKLADALTRQNDIHLLKKKDYIENPKPNGYRSLHLIVSVPVFYAESVKEVKVEVQIRTIAMDFWASLEHQIKYKKNDEEGKKVAPQLKECAEKIADTDRMMQEIRMQMEQLKSEPFDAYAVYQKLKQLDMAIS